MRVVRFITVCVVLGLIFISGWKSDSASEYEYDNDVKQVVTLEKGESNTFRGEEKTKNAIVEVESAEFVSEEIDSLAVNERLLQIKVNMRNRGARTYFYQKVIFRFS